MPGKSAHFDLPTKVRELRVLIVEDDEDDLLVLKEALQQSELSWSTSISCNGQEAITFLENELKASKALPDFILSDIKTPLMDGFDLLQWVRSHPKLKHIPVLFFTSSSLPADLERARHLGANGYQVKPTQFVRYKDIILSMDEAIRTERPYLPVGF